MSSKQIVNTVNFKIIAVIIVAILFFHFYVNFVLDVGSSDVVISITSFINPLAASLASFLVSYRYKDSKIFGRSFVILGFAFLAIFLGEVSYLIYDLVLDIDPYPSFADLFFFLEYPLILIPIIMHLRFFLPSFSKIAKIWLILLPVVITSGYFAFSWITIGEFNLDFYLGILFVAASSLTLGFVLFASSVFRQSELGKAWLLLAISLVALNIGDVGYYYIELGEGYDLQHPINLFWYASYWLAFYSLIKHKELI